MRKIPHLKLALFLAVGEGQGQWALVCFQAQGTQARTVVVSLALKQANALWPRPSSIPTKETSTNFWMKEPYWPVLTYNLTNM